MHLKQQEAVENTCKTATNQKTARFARITESRQALRHYDSINKGEILCRQ